jgi:hypothetical protein
MKGIWSLSPEKYGFVKSWCAYLGRQHQTGTTRCVCFVRRIFETVLLLIVAWFKIEAYNWALVILKPSRSMCTSEVSILQCETVL